MSGIRREWSTLRWHAVPSLAVLRVPFLVEPVSSQIGPVLEGLLYIVPRIERIRVQSLLADAAVGKGAEDLSGHRVGNFHLGAGFPHKERFPGSEVLQRRGGANAL